MARVNAQALALCVLVLVHAVVAQEGWFNARATLYTGPGNGGDAGSCGFGRINSRFATDRMFCAWPDNDGSKCGKCLEIKCDERAVSNPYGRTWEYTKYQCNGQSVIAMVTDNCPKAYNQEWCSGDMPHCDLSYESFQKIVKAVDGIAATKMRWVECPGRIPTTCGNELKAYETCGGGNGPYPDKCCSRYLKCTQKHAHFWQCLGDMDTNWNDGSQSSGPTDGGSSSSSNSGTPTFSGDVNKRKRTKKNTTTRRRNAPKPSGGNGGGKGRALGRWQQCGGIGGPTGNKKGGRDGQWAGYRCKAGSCRRSNNWFWQCQ